MHVLSYDIILKISVLLALALAVSAVNAVVVTRYRRDTPVVLFHISSLFCMAGLFCILIKTSILNLDFEPVFDNAGRMALLLSVLMYIMTAIIYAVGRKDYRLRFPSMDLKSVFQTVDDLTIVSDYKGRIVDVNDPDLLNSLQSKTETVQELIRTLGAHADSAVLDDIAARLPALKEKLYAEIQLKKIDAWYALGVFPVFAGVECLGYTIILQNITHVKKTEQLLQVQNDALEQANLKLARDAHLAGVLEAERERLRVLEKVQTDLAQQIENTITQVAYIRNRHAETDLVVQQEAARIADQLRWVYKEVRKSISSISGKEREHI